MRTKTRIIRLFVVAFLAACGLQEVERVHTHNILLEAGAIEKEIDIDEAFTMRFLKEIYGETE